VIFLSNLSVIRIKANVSIIIFIGKTYTGAAFVVIDFIFVKVALGGVNIATFFVAY
jgi:hypothetical protein